MAESNGPKILIALWIMTAIPFVFMLLRFYVKERYSKIFGWDDWLLALSWVFALVYTVLTHIGVNYGLGKHFADTDKTKISTGIEYMYLGELFALLAMPTSKTSFCVTLLRLTETPWHKHFIWFIIITLNLALWGCIAVTFAQCEPVEKLWDLTLPGKCWDNRIVIYYSVFVGAYSCLLDFFLTACPWLIIWKLQMNKREKFGIIITMSLGCLAGIACAVKTAYIPQIGTWLDFTYNSADVLIWGLSETSITIVAASIPFLRVMVREKSSHGRSYHLGSSSHPYDTSSRSKSAGFHMEPVVKRKTDESSDKSILNEAGPGGIVQTNEIRIEYGSDEERDVEGLEKIQKEIARYGAARS